MKKILACLLVTVFSTTTFADMILLDPYVRDPVHEEYKQYLAACTGRCLEYGEWLKKYKGIETPTQVTDEPSTPTHVAPTFTSTVPHVVTTPTIDTPSTPTVNEPTTPAHVAPTFEPTVPHSPNFVRMYEDTCPPEIVTPTFTPTYMDDPLPSIEGKTIESTHKAPDYISDFATLDNSKKQYSDAQEKKVSTTSAPTNFNTTVTSGSSATSGGTQTQITGTETKTVSASATTSAKTGKAAKTSKKKSLKELSKKRK